MIVQTVSIILYLYSYYLGDLFRVYVELYN